MSTSYFGLDAVCLFEARVLQIGYAAFPSEILGQLEKCMYTKTNSQGSCLE
jgi:hypothetical protein